MSRFFEDLETQLEKAAQAQTGAAAGGGDRPPSQRRRPVTRAIPVALAVGVTAAVVVAVALTLHGSRHPRPAPPAAHAATAATTTSQAPHSAPPASASVAGAVAGMPIIGHLSPKQRHEITYVFSAETAAMKSVACRPPAIPRTTVSEGSPSSALLSELGVLRRAAKPVDELTFPKTSGHVYPVNAETVFVNYIRRARVKDGVSYYLIPVGHIIEPQAFSPLCVAKQKSLLQQDLRRLPASDRSSTVALQAKMIAALGGTPNGSPQHGVCIWGAAAPGRGGGTCETAGQITDGGPVEENGSTLVGVVPDGVASVAFRYPAGKGMPAFTVTANVVGNVYAASTGRLIPGAGFPPQMIWRSASGTVIKKTSIPAG